MDGSKPSKVSNMANKIAVRMKDKSNSRHLFEQEITIVGHNPKEVEETPEVIQLIKNGVFEKVKLKKEEKQAAKPAWEDRKEKVLKAETIDEVNELVADETSSNVKKAGDQRRLELARAQADKAEIDYDENDSWEDVLKLIDEAEEEEDPEE